MYKRQVEEWTKSYLQNEIDDILFYNHLKVIHCLRFVHSILDRFVKNKSIIFFNVELSSKSNIDNCFSLSQLEDEINDLLQDLREKAEENGWIIVESYKDFFNKSSLLNWMDSNNPQQNNSYEYKKMFGNDFVLLNNTDSASGEVDSSSIEPEILLEQVLEKDIQTKDTFFCYTRGMGGRGAEFIRNTFYVPKNYRNKEYITKFASLVKEIIINKEQKNVR